MNEEPVNLDARRGMNAQKETQMRRQLAGVKADQAALKARRSEFEQFLLSKPITSKKEAAVKARYVIALYAATPDGRDPQRAILIAQALDGLDRFFKLTPSP